MEEMDMTQHLNNLEDLLKREIAMLERIRELELEKNSFLSENKTVMDLSPLNSRMELLLKEENLLEQRREALLRELSLYYKSESLTLLEIIEKLPVERKDSLTEIRKRLQILTEEIKSYNELNKIIIEDVLKLVGYALDHFAQERSLEIDYGKNKGQSKECRSVVLNTVI